MHPFDSLASNSGIQAVGCITLYEALSRYPTSIIYKILRECKIKIWPIIDAMTRFIESMMGYIEKGGGCTLMPGDGCSFVLRSFRSEVPHGVAHYVWTNQLFYNIQKSVV